MWAGFWKRDFSQKQRDKGATQGWAMDDGSFPIKNTGDLQNAVSLAHSSKHPFEAVKAHIVARARALGAVGSLPDTWNVKKSEAIKTADHPYSASCDCMQCKADRGEGPSPVADNAAPNTPWDDDKVMAGGKLPPNEVSKDGDLSDADLAANGGKLQPEDGPKFKRKKPALDDRTMG
jgi:hypothetical protein